MNWFRRHKPSAMPALPDIVETVFRNHPSDCIFAPGARDRILAKAQEAFVLHNGDSTVLIDVLEEAFRAEEIYCPHEGIDRRAEFGMAA